MKPRFLSRPAWRWAVLPAVLLLGGCDVMGMLGIETAAQVAAQREADGKAVGSGCRHAERSIEECYQNNPRASKAAVFAGWREMDEYMREHKVAGMPPKPPLVIDETADGAPVATRPGTSQSASAPGNRSASASAPNNQVRPTGTSVAPATPSVRPVLPAPSTPSPSSPSSGSAPRPASSAAGSAAPRPPATPRTPASAPAGTSTGTQRNG